MTSCVCMWLIEILCLAFYYKGEACELLSNPQAAEGHFKNALSVIDNCSSDDKTRLSHEYGLGKFCHFQDMVCYGGKY